jgi:hypothetical protein
MFSLGILLETAKYYADQIMKKKWWGSGTHGGIRNKKYRIQVGKAEMRNHLGFFGV